MLSLCSVDCWFACLCKSKCPHRKSLLIMIIPEGQDSIVGYTNND